MTLQFGTITRNVGSGHPDDEVTLSAVKIETNEDMLELRHEHVDWHEDAMRVMKFPTAPYQATFTHEPPPTLLGRHIRALPGAIITKDEAGNFGFGQDEEFIAS